MKLYIIIGILISLLTLPFLGGCISSLAVPFVAAEVISNLPTPEPPTSDGLVVLEYPNPVPFSSLKQGWAYTIELKNPLTKKIIVSRVEIKGIAKFSIVSFPIPDEVLDAAAIREKFGSNQIPPGESLTWEKIYTRDDIKEMIKKYDSYPGVNVENAIFGLNINIKAKGYDEDNNFVEGTSGTITFTNKVE